MSIPLAENMFLMVDKGAKIQMKNPSSVLGIA